MRVSIIMPVWNGLEHHKTCLPTIAKQTHKDIEVILSEMVLLMEA